MADTPTLIPGGWKSIRLGEVAETKSGGTPSRDNPSYYIGSIPWLKSGELNDDEIIDAEERINEEAIESSSAKVFAPGTLLVAMYGATVGKTGLLMISSATNQAICAIIPRNGEFLPEFMMYYMVFRRNDLLNQRYGAAQPNISQQLLRNLEVTLPPVSEQREIARVVTTIRRARHAARQVIEAAREMKRSVMMALFRGQEDEGQETELGVLPAGWNVEKIGDLFDIQQGKALSPAARTGDSPRPFLRTANVLWGRIDVTSVDQMDFSEEEAEFYELKPEDLLICEGGDIGRTAMWNGELEPCYYQNHLHRLRPKQDGLVSRFYMYWMDAAMNLFGLYVGQGNLTTIPNLSKGRLSAFLVPVPAYAQQKAIARHIMAIDEKIRLEESRIAKLQDLYQTLLHDLVSGKVRLKAKEVEANA